MWCDKKNFEYANIVIPAEIDGYTIKAIGKNAFLWHKLKSVAIENGIDSIAKNAFFDCAIDEITLPQTLRYRGPIYWRTMFYQIGEFQSLILPPSIIDIRPNAFYGSGDPKMHLPQCLE